MELKSKRLLSVPIPLPSLDEQRRILKYVKAASNAQITEAQSLREKANIETEVLLASSITKKYLTNTHGR
ncbi:MAG: restriction endonuclease subunit S [Anaerolineales bacterium]|nr:restriction endonuclease subunit S [Anaerolineales bacterium]